MKVKLHVLAMVAGKVVKNLDVTQFQNAVKAFIGRNADKEAISSTAKQSKVNGDYFVASLSQKTDKQYGSDARAIHWLALHAELATLGLCDGEFPLPAADVLEWLEKFQVKVPATPVPTTA